MFDFLKQPRVSAGLLCPKCEKLFEGHDEGNCKRKMSRRFFMGAATGIVVAAAIPASISTGHSRMPLSAPQIAAGRDLIEAPVVEAPPPEAWFPGAKFGMFEHGSQRFVAEFRREGMITYGTHYGLPLKEEVAKLRTEGYRVILSDNYKTLTDEVKRIDSHAAFGFSSLYIPHS